MLRLLLRPLLRLLLRFGLCLGLRVGGPQERGTGAGGGKRRHEVNLPDAGLKTGKAKCHSNIKHQCA